MNDIAIIDSQRKKKRGAPLNNINGSKNKWATFWRRRVVKDADKWIIPMLADYSDGLIADKGGSDSITAAERRMIEIAQTARGASMLILKESSERGLIVQTDNGWDLAPGAKELAKFLNVELSALKTIGLAKREPKQLSLQDILAQAEVEADENASSASAFKPGRANGAADDQEPQPEADRAYLSGQGSGEGGTDER